MDLVVIMYFGYVGSDSSYTSLSYSSNLCLENDHRNNSATNNSATNWTTAKPNPTSAKKYSLQKQKQDEWFKMNGKANQI